MAIWAYILLAILLMLLVGLSALFSFSEMAISSANKSRLKSIINSNTSSNKDKKQAKRVLHFTENYNEHISSIVIFNNIVNILFSTLSTVFFVIIAKEEMNAESVGPLMSFALMTPVVIIFGEIIPKQLAKKFPEIGTMKLSWTLQIVNLIMKPITFILSKLVKEEETTMLNSDEEIHHALDEATKAGVTTSFEQSLIRRSLELDETKIIDVMVPLKDVATISGNITKTLVDKLISGKRHSRFPVIDEEGNVVAIFSGTRYLVDKLKNKTINMDDYKLSSFQTFDWDDNPFHIFEGLRSRREKMAIILGPEEEFIGIITIEDIVELLFGEIYDEDDVEADGVYDLNETSFILNPEVNLSYFIEKYVPSIKVKEEEKKFTIKEWVNTFSDGPLKPGSHHIYKNIIIWVKEDNNDDKKIIFEIDII